MAVSIESPLLNAFNCFDESLLQNIYDEASETLSSLSELVGTYEPSVKLHEEFLESLSQKSSQQEQAIFSSFSFRTRLPSSFLDQHCCLQKDQGKGQSIGSNICARGKNQCLHKIRQKLDVMTKFANGSASVNRRDARVTAETPDFIETRSMIDARLGFLSITYGLLLRWGRNGKISFIVLRKMCHDSFYAKELQLPVPLLETRPASFRCNDQGTNASITSLSNLHRDQNRTHIYFQGGTGTEVVYLDREKRQARRTSF
mmetsp:Transcript_16718/g.25257  ORF Transcript_16718/g.25257 Transcript_16718/m.25257 type:complete len:259 (+) Transcript_16718:182-958(+)